MSKLLQSLQNAALYDHQVSHFELLETHISWVLLTGPYAYKIKKPVNFSFVDFAKLQQRRFYCYEELRLNRRLAPELYLDVCTITGTDERPVIGGHGPVIEYMVKMKQFEQHQLLNNLANQSQLDCQHIDLLANTIAMFHQDIKRASCDSTYGKPEQIYRWVEQNFQQIKPLLKSEDQIIELEQLKSWTLESYRNHESKLAQRKQHAYIRECHGDLHLGNIALIDNEVTIFDGIEFNEELRWIDVISEIAFLIMDLFEKSKPELANRFLDHYLAATGDYDGITVLQFYLVYRAMIRGKVGLLRLTQNPLTQHHTHVVAGEYRRYVDLAFSFIKPHSPVLLITHGLAGSGKSTLASKIVQELGVIRIRSDVERKRLFGLSANHRSVSGVGSGIYTADATSETYTQLSRLCEKVINASYSVIVDAGFLQQWQRIMFQKLAKKLNVKFIIIDLQAPVDELRKRVEDRWRKNQDPSEANLEVLEAQLCHHQVLTACELVNSLAANTNNSGFSKIFDEVRKKMI